VNWERLNQAEATVIRSSAVLPADKPHPLVTVVTTISRGGGLWWLLCGVLALRSGQSRRIALRAATAVGTTLLVAHGLKAVLPRRRRPDPQPLPAPQALPERPRSSAFPSAHSATAAAFVTAVTLEDARLGLAAAPLAALAAYGRIRTRVHWPTDLLAGAALGAGLAAVTRHLPRRLFRASRPGRLGR
jgi:membrane-associated phospholipid phosphatase